MHRTFGQPIRGFARLALAAGCLALNCACTNGQLLGSRYLSNILNDGGPGETVGNGDLVLDASEDVYMVGPVSGGMDGYAPIGVQDYYVTKYASTGLRQWTALDGASGGTVASIRIALDADGNAYVTGYGDKGMDGKTFIAGGTHEDYFLTKYDPNGNRIWTVEDGALGGDTETHGITVDPSANVYIVGQSNKAIDGNSALAASTTDLFVSKYDTNGNRQWTQEDGISGIAANAWGLVIDSGNNVVISGRVATAGAPTGLDGAPMYPVRSNYFVIKYDSGGNRQWTVQDGGIVATTGPGLNLFTAAIDSNDNVIIAGDTGVGLEGHTQVGTNDLFITKYSPAGVLQWTVQDGSTGASAAPYGLAIDPSGEIYVGANIQFNGLDGNPLIGVIDLIATKYDSNGNRLWTVEDGAPNTVIEVRGMALDPFGVLYLSGDIAPTGPAPQPTIGIDGIPLIGSQDLFQSRYSSSGVRE